MAQLFYMEKDDEIAYVLDWFKDLLEDNGKKEIILYEMKREFKTGFIWCSLLQECFENTDSMCGKVCEDYKPRNGKSGRCKYHDVGLTYTGRKFLFNKNGMKEITRPVNPA
jgi:hypothetical protein